MKENFSYFKTGKDGRISRNFWDNIFCCMCGKELTPDESYGTEPDEMGTCEECCKIILLEK